MYAHPETNVFIQNVSTAPGDYSADADTMDAINMLLCDADPVELQQIIDKQTLLNQQQTAATASSGQFQLSHRNKPSRFGTSADMPINLGEDSNGPTESQPVRHWHVRKTSCLI